ncbi:hypothetical protein EUGRSUZ_J01504 [Eucalyptus grandis]|uniref:Uncharacterized protein n=2 Tax=Eucalyptus grandis TaxID=71139 RepID=A0ACC3J575_EUCGR|nr:hypothetical protein EUGRSUZ_J01504 [Eucalyptus grandis]
MLGCLDTAIRSIYIALSTSRWSTQNFILMVTFYGWSCCNTLYIISHGPISCPDHVTLTIYPSMQSKGRGKDD